MKFLVLFFLLITNEVLACSEFNWDWSTEKWVQNSDAIYHGIVASISLSDQSIYDGETDPLSNVVTLRGERYIKLKVSETLKGEAGAVVTAVLPECLGGVAGFGDTAILFKVGDVWHIRPLTGNYADETASNILQKLSSVKHQLDLSHKN